LTVNANTAICLSVLGLAANARYGLSIQLLGIISGMAGVWTQVKWPVIGQQRARHDYAAIQRTLWPRMWLQYLTFLAMAAGLLLCGQPLLQLFGSGKQMLPLPWLALLAFGVFLEMQVSIWGTLISTANRIPFLWPSIAANLLAFALSLTLIHTTSLGLGPSWPIPSLTIGIGRFTPPVASRPPGRALCFPGRRAIPARCRAAMRRLDQEVLRSVS